MVFGCAVAPLLFFHFLHQRPRRVFQQALQAVGKDLLEEVEYHQIALRDAPGHHAHACLLDGVIDFKAGHYADAVERLEFTLDHPQTRTLGLLFSGESQLCLGHLQRGEAALLAALEQDASIIDAHRWLAAAYFDTGAYHAALEHLKSWAELAMDDPRPRWMAARAHRSLGMPEAAIDDFRRALSLAAGDQAGRLSPGDIDAIRYELAGAELAVDDDRQALKDLEPCGDDADILVLRAKCHRKLGDAVQARAAASRALQLAPDHAAAGLLLAQLDFELRSLDDAKRRLVRLTEKYPEIGQLREALAAVLRLQGKDEAADEEERRAAELAVNRREVRALSAKAGMAPADAALRLRMAERAANLGMFQEARLWVRLVLAIDPKNEAALSLLQRLPICTLEGSDADA